MKFLIRSLIASALLVTAVPAQANVPFSGVFAGTGSPVATVIGHSTHMGRITGTAVVVMITPTGFIGMSDWRAANGDRLFAEIVVTLTGPTSTPGEFTFFETAVYTGGTGRFAGVSGNATGTGTYNFITTDFAGIFNGHLSSVGSN
ncbi:MAG: hypothetical protein ABIP94_20880 [Planctomycetota bacterium]